MRKTNDSIDSSLISQDPTVLADPSEHQNPQLLENDRLLRIDEAASMLGLSVGGTYHLVSQHRIPVVRISARCIRFSRRALLEWIESLSKFADHSG